MTTISIPGKITAIEIDDSSDVDYAIVSLTGTAESGPSGTRTLISPSGKSKTIVLASNSPSTGLGGPEGFELSSDFNVGDIVEVYNVGNPIYGGNVITDENGNQFSTSAQKGGGLFLRKIATGSTAPTWGFVT